jgi:hypothetical protein
MVRWFPRLILVVIASLAFGSCGSCTCGKKVEEAPRLFPTPHAGLTLPTLRPSPTAMEQEPSATPAVEATKAAEPPTPLPVASLPEDFPKDLPVFAGSQPFNVQQLAGNAKNVLFQVDAERPEIFQYYRDEMQTKGWKLTQEYDARYQSFLAFKKGDTLTQMTISTDPRTGKRVVAIMYQKEEKLPFPEF